MIVLENNWLLPQPDAALLGIPKDLELRDSLDRPYVLVPWADVISDVLS